NASDPVDVIHDNEQSNAGDHKSWARADAKSKKSIEHSYHDGGGRNGKKWNAHQPAKRSATGMFRIPHDGRAPPRKVNRCVEVEQIKDKRAGNGDHCRCRSVLPLKQNRDCQMQKEHNEDWPPELTHRRAKLSLKDVSRPERSRKKHFQSALLLFG